MEHRKQAPQGTRVVFFDLDDTIYDRTDLRLDVLLDGEGPVGSVRSGAGSLTAAIARINRAARLFESLGFPNLRHHAESPEMIAALTLLWGDPARFPSSWRVDAARQNEFLEALDAVDHLLLRFDSRRWEGALLRELALHRLTGSSSAYEHLREALHGASRSPEVVSEHDRVRSRQVWQAYGGFEKTWRAFESSGALCCIASDGEEKLQREKLAQLGLGDDFTGRLLTTGRASSPLDADALSTRVRTLVEAAAEGAAGEKGEELAAGEKEPGEEGSVLSLLPDALTRLYPFKWLLDRFSVKSPEFYARALHAVVASPERPQSGLDDLAVLSGDDWRDAAVRLVMVGDNYEKDVRPLSELLGPAGLSTLLLRIGRYSRGVGEPHSGPPPTSEFDSWDDLCSFVAGGFSWTDVPLVVEAPRLWSGAAASEDPDASGPQAFRVSGAAESEFGVVRKLVAAG